MDEILNTLTDNITPLLLFLTAVAGIIDNSTKISAKPLTKFLKWLGSKLNADISDRLDSQEAFLLNDFYQKHSMGKRMTKEQYENAIKMFEEHLKRGANSVNAEHLKELKEYYHYEFCRTR